MALVSRVQPIPPVLLVVLNIYVTSRWWSAASVRLATNAAPVFSPPVLVLSVLSPPLTQVVAVDTSWSSPAAMTASVCTSKISLIMAERTSHSVEAASAGREKSTLSPTLRQPRTPVFSKPTDIPFFSPADKSMQRRSIVMFVTRIVSILLLHSFQFCKGLLNDLAIVCPVGHWDACRLCPGPLVSSRSGPAAGCRTTSSSFQSLFGVNAFLA